MQPLSQAQTTKFKRILLIGDSGTGKTTVSATAPGNICYADFDRRLGVLDPEQPNLFFESFSDPFEPKSVVEMGWHKFKDFVKTWRIKPEADWLVWDSLTSGAEAAMAYTLYKEGKTLEAVSLPVWGKAINEVKKMLGYLTTLPCHVIVNAHFQYVKDEALGGILYLPLIYGRELPGHVPIHFMDVWRTYVEGGGQDKGPIYRVQVRPTDSRFQAIRNTLSLPADVTYVEPNLRELLKEKN